MTKTSLKTTNFETKSAPSNRLLTAAEKNALHGELDSKWQSLIVPFEHNRKNFRSYIYQLWAAVIVGQDKSLDVSGIIRSFCGKSLHIAIKSKIC